MNSFHEIMHVFGQKIGVSDLQPKEDGSYHLLFDDHWLVRCFTSGTNLIIWGVLAEIPQDQIEARDFYRQVFKLNLIRFRKQLESVSMESQSRELILFRKVKLALLTADDLQLMVETFVNTLEDWQRLITVKETKASPYAMPFLFP
ncbi:MAG: type III secretion system chaperone [Desulfobacterales bacterium]|nr:type III secretion system chaperone [Desulfobacterales bacterium]